MRPASPQVVAEELGVSKGSRYKWKDQLLGHDASAPMNRQQDAPASPDRSELEQQLEALQRDIRRLQLEKHLYAPAPENVLNRDFSASARNEKWLTDITEIQIPAGKVNRSLMIDCLDAMVVSGAIGTRPDAELVNTMLDAAIDKVTASGDRPVVHSDRGDPCR